MTKTCYRCKIEKDTSEFNKQNKSRKRDKLDSYCRTCRKEVYAEYYALNKQKLIAYQRLRGQGDHLLRRYGLALHEYHEMLDNQGGVCAICGDPETNGSKLSVDHNHNTRKVRALLCNDCNLGLARFKEDAKLLLKASQYLELHDSYNKEGNRGCS